MVGTYWITRTDGKRLCLAVRRKPVFNQQNALLGQPPRRDEIVVEPYLAPYGVIRGR